jgi:hypothetical protein
VYQIPSARGIASTSRLASNLSPKERQKDMSGSLDTRSAFESVQGINEEGHVSLAPCKHAAHELTIECRKGLVHFANGDTTKEDIKPVQVSRSVTPATRSIRTTPSLFTVYVLLSHRYPLAHVHRIVVNPPRESATVVSATASLADVPLYDV